MAAIDHTSFKVPHTVAPVTLDGTVQQIQYPPFTRYIWIRGLSIATTLKYKLQNTSAPVDAGLIEILNPETVGYGWPLTNDASTGTGDGDKSPLYIQGTDLDTVVIEYSHVGGRGS